LGVGNPGLFALRFIHENGLLVLCKHSTRQQSQKHLPICTAFPNVKSKFMQISWPKHRRTRPENRGKTKQNTEICKYFYS